MNKKQLVIVLLSILLAIVLISGFVLCCFGMAGTLDWEHRYSIGAFLIFIDSMPIFGFMAFLYEYCSQPRVGSEDNDGFTQDYENLCNDYRRISDDARRM